MIKLQNGYCIESDGTQYILKSKIIRKKKDSDEEYEAEEVKGYYGNIEQALNGYVDKVMLDYTKFDAISLYQILDVLKEIRKEIQAYK